MFLHVHFDGRRVATWVAALCAFVWLFSSVNAEVGFQVFCPAEWTPALFTVMRLLSTVGEQMLGKICFCDWRVVARFAFVWFFSNVNAKVTFQISCLSEWPPTLFTVMWLLSTVGEKMLGKIFLWFKKIRTNCIDLAFLWSACWCDL